MEEKIRNRVFEFFIESHDFNGIPLRNISEEFKIGLADFIAIRRQTKDVTSASSNAMQVSSSSCPSSTAIASIVNSTSCRLVCFSDYAFLKTLLSEASTISQLHNFMGKNLKTYALIQV